jgi:hypothetical protein
VSTAFATGSPGNLNRRRRPDPGRFPQDLFESGSFDTTRGSLQVWITTMTRNLLVDNFRRTRNQRATVPSTRAGIKPKS